MNKIINSLKSAINKLRRDGAVEMVEELEITLQNARALNRGLELLLSVVRDMEEEEHPPKRVLVSQTIVDDIYSLTNFLYQSSIVFSKERMDQIERIRDALKGQL